MSTGGGMLFVYLDHNDINVSKHGYAWTNLQFMEKKESGEAMEKQYFQMQCVHVIYTFD